jgi:hypothetical protein
MKNERGAVGSFSGPFISHTEFLYVTQLFFYLLFTQIFVDVILLRFVQKLLGTTSFFDRPLFFLFVGPFIFVGPLASGRLFLVDIRYAPDSGRRRGTAWSPIR